MACEADDTAPSDSPYACPVLLYHRCLLPNWLRHHATWNCDKEGSDLHLKIKADSANWENIFRVQLLPPSLLTDHACDDITVNMVIGVMDCDDNENTISFLLSDDQFSMGFQLNGPDNCSEDSPIIAVEGEPGKILRNVNQNVACAPQGSNGSQRNNSGEFFVTIMPRNAWGKASTQTCDGGTKVVAQYSDCLDLTKGLRLDLYRFKCTDRYDINYIEVTVYKDSPRIYKQYTTSLPTDSIFSC